MRTSSYIMEDLRSFLFFGGMHMENKTFYYARVSSDSQNLARQIDLFKQMGANDRDIFCDKKSGKDFDREQYLLLRNGILREGDTLIIKELDRLGRNKEEIKKELEYFRSKKIMVRILDLPTTMMEIPEGQYWIWEMVNSVLIEVLGTIAEQERIKVKRRQQEGLACMPLNKDGKKYSAKTGRTVGRPTVTYPKDWDLFYGQYKNGELSAKECMEKLSLKKTSFYKLIRQYKQN